MCWYSTLPTIGIGCGIDTDHFARSGVIGNGARPIWGMPASLATLDTAMVGGVVDDPMMMSALDSVTKRRALVVAFVGSPPSSRTMSLSGTPAISFGTKLSAVRAGMPSDGGAVSAAPTSPADGGKFLSASSLGCYFINQNSRGISAPFLDDAASRS